MLDYEDQDQDQKVTQYLIPANVSTKYEIFEGFGWAEAKYVVIALLIGFSLFLMTGLFKKTEQFNIKDIPQNETIGLRNDKNTSIDGDIVTRNRKVIPKTARFLFIFISGVGTYIAVKRDSSTGMSLVTNIIALKEFSKKQKRYMFKYNSGSEVLSHAKK